MLLANDAVRALLTGRRLAALFEPIVDRTLMHGNPDDANRIAARIFLVRKWRPPAMMAVDDDHIHRLRLCVIHTLHAAIAVTVVECGVHFSNADKYDA